MTRRLTDVPRKIVAPSRWLATTRRKTWWGRAGTTSQEGRKRSTGISQAPRLRRSLRERCGRRFSRLARILSGMRNSESRLSSGGLGKKGIRPRARRSERLVNCRWLDYWSDLPSKWRGAEFATHDPGQNPGQSVEKPGKRYGFWLLR
jgi:hypothetical protein